VRRVGSWVVRRISISCASVPALAASSTFRISANPSASDFNNCFPANILFFNVSRAGEPLLQRIAR
jgi:hypothetical protein